MPIKDKGLNPLKIVLSALCLIFLAIMGSGAWRGEAHWPNFLWAALPLAVLAWSLARTHRRIVRRSWQLHQILLALAATSLAVQRTGGVSGPMAGLYILLVLWTVFRASWPWSLLVPLGAVLVEGLASFYGGRLMGDRPWLLMLATSLLGSVLLARMLLKGGRSLSARGLDFDEPQEPIHDLRSDLAYLVALAHSSLGARTAAVFLLDPERSCLDLAAYKTYSPEMAKRASIEVNRSFLGWVVKERQALLYAEFHRDVRDLGYYQGGERVGSLLAVPLLEGQRVLGLLVADSDQPNKFTEEGKMMAAGFAHQASRLVSLNLKHTALGLEHERLREWNRRLEMMASRLKVEDVVAIMRDLIPQLVDCDRLVLLEMLPEAKQARVLLTDPNSLGGPAAGSVIDIGGTLAEQAWQLKQWRSVEDFYRRHIDLARYTREESRDHGFRSVLIAPLMIDDDCRYLLGLESRRPGAFNASQDTIHIVANQFSIALRSAAMYEEKETLALRDGLTGLWNHRHFQERLEQMLADDRSRALCLALFDIDHFKKLNDTYGHPIGDAVLREVAARIKGNISQFDFAARYGGEEFVVVWPGSDLKQAEHLAESLRQAIGHKPFVTQAGELEVTVSMGLAFYPGDAQNKGALILAADQALYAAKRSGRNRLVCYRCLNGRKE